MDGFRPILAAWSAALEIARQDKQVRFGRDADEGMKFLTGPYNFLYDNAGVNDPHFSVGNTKYSAVPLTPKAPSFRMQVNKTAEFVQLFGPALYHKNPQRQVSPRKPYTVPDETLQVINQTDPNTAVALAQMSFQGVQAASYDRIGSSLIGTYLNATPNPLDLKTECRRAIDEALVKGMSFLWTESYVPAGSTARCVGSFHVSVDDIVIDTGADCFEECKWIARKRYMSAADVSKKFGIPIQDLKPAIESRSDSAVVNSEGSDGLDKRRKGASYGTVIFWEIYSKCGLSGQMYQKLGDDVQAFSDAVAPEYAYIAFCPKMPDYPLNCPKSVMNSVATPESVQDVKNRFVWEVPFWADGSWPCTPIYFHEVPNEPWPLSHLAPAMGELKFLNWFYSYVAGKVMISSRDIIAIAKKASKVLKSAIQEGSDYTIIELEEANGNLDSVIKFLSHPAINGDVFKIADIIEHQFEKRTGMTELIYGLSGKQLRSATEAEIKNDATNVRPDDMANRVEDAMSQVARLEAIAARFTLQGTDVSFMCGDVAGQLWDMFVVRSDPKKALYETDYRIEAGSIRKPNRSRDAENMTAFVQTFGQQYLQIATNPMAPYVDPYNAMLRRWCEVRDMDPTPFLLNPMMLMPPPMLPAPGAGGQGQLAA